MINQPANVAAWFASDSVPRHLEVTALICGVGADLTVDLTHYEQEELNSVFYLEAVGHRVTEPNQLKELLPQAIASGRPTVLDCVIDREEFPRCHLTWKVSKVSCAGWTCCEDGASYADHRGRVAG